MHRHRDRLGDLHISTRTIPQRGERLLAHLRAYRADRVRSLRHGRCSPWPIPITSRYPAGHLYVHQSLYNLTVAGQNVWKAQQLYAALYVATLTLTVAIYKQAGGVPNWILFLLPLSKRLHSIHVLRLFNDCWTVFGAQAAILAFVTGWDGIGILLLGYVIHVINQFVPSHLVVSRCESLDVCGPSQSAALRKAIRWLRDAVVGSESSVEVDIHG